MSEGKDKTNDVDSQKAALFFMEDTRRKSLLTGANTWGRKTKSCTNNKRISLAPANSQIVGAWGSGERPHTLALNETSTANSNLGFH